MRIRLQLLANQNWRSNGCYQSLACALGSGYENGDGVETPISFLSSGFVDDHIRLLINELDNENELKMIENVQNFFESHYRLEYERRRMLSKIKNIKIGIYIRVVRVSVMVLRLVS